MPEPDVLLHGGSVITLDRASTRAEAITVRDGRIVAVGASAELLREAGPGTRRVDLAGRAVVPGFFDAHPHLDREGLRARGGVPIAGLGSVAEIVDAVRAAAAAAEPGAWVVVMPMGAPPHGYVSRPEQLREGRFPTRHDLDPVSPRNPVYLRAPWGWWSRLPLPSVANSLALERAGVTRDTPAPPEVEIVRDARGEPTGLFLERNWAPTLEHTLFRCVPRFTLADRVEGVRLGAAAHLAAGTTAAYEGHGVSPPVLAAYRRVHARGQLGVRMHLALSLPTASHDDRAVAELLSQHAGVAAGRGLGDDRLRVGGITLDSASPRVAATLAAGYPYEGWAGHFYQALPADRLVELGVLAARLGLRVNSLICYGLETVLRAFEAIDREVAIRERRWVLIHLVEATADQLRRMRALGVGVTVTPNFMYTARDRFGLDRLGARGVPLREALDAGLPVSLSTDGVPCSMLWTMWEALARRDADSGSRLGDSRLTREEALRLAVQHGHWLTWSEDDRGVLEVGRAADLVVLDGDPLTCEQDRIKDLAVDLTMVGGRIVHERTAAAAPPGAVS